MRRLLAVLGLSVVLSGAAAVRSAHAEEPPAGDDSPTTTDFALKFLDHVERWHGGTTNSPLEKSLRAKLEKLGEAEAGDAGGFEPPSDTTVPPQPGDDDEQFSNLKDIMQKMSALDRVKAAIWFLVIRPSTAHQGELLQIIDQQAQSLQPQERADLQDYLGVRRSIGGASVASRIDRWQQYVRQKPHSAFADTAQREIAYDQSLQKEAHQQNRQKHGHFLVKVGVVLIVLALIAVIIFGAAK